MCVYVLFVYRTVVAMVCKDGVALGVEKIVTSKLYEPGVNKRIFIIDQHIGMVITTPTTTTTSIDLNMFELNESLTRRVCMCDCRQLLVCLPMRAKW